MAKKKSDAGEILNALLQQLTWNDQVIFTVKVRPQAQRTQVTGQLADGTIKIDLAAVPEDGKANAELIKFLAKEFDVPRSSVELIAGQTSRKKVMKIMGIHG